MKEKTFLHLHRNDVSMTLGGGSNGHPLSIHSASIGGRRNIRGMKYVSMLLMALFLCVGNVWAIDWTAYGSVPKTGGQYYLYSLAGGNGGTANHKFFNSVTTVSNKKYINGTSSNGAILFTFGTVTLSNGKYNVNQISFVDNETTYYLQSFKNSTTGAWRGTANHSTWNLEFAKVATYFPNINNDSCAYWIRGHYGNNADSVLYAINRSVTNYGNMAEYTRVKSINAAAQQRPWVLITPEAYEDATAGTTGYTGAQYYYTANAAAYTDGVASSAGGTAKVAPKTYKKPTATDQTLADFATSVSGQKGKYEGNPTITVYYQATLTPGYEFLGWFETATGDGDPVSTTLEYTATFTATSTDSENKTVKNLYARFHELPSVANLYVGATGEPTEYKTLGAAITAASNGDKIALVAEIGEGALTIDKNITLDFNGYSIVGSVTDLVTISAGNVTFVDNSLGTPGGVTTTGATAVLVSGGSLTINDGVFEATTCAVQCVSGTATINRGGFKTNNLADATKDVDGDNITFNGGYFLHKNGVTVTDAYAVVSDIPTGMKYSANDYNYMVVAKNSPNYPVCVVISESESAPTIRQNFNTLAGAIAYVNNANDETTNTILMREDHTLQAGNYTIPTNAILVIPYSAEQTAVMPSIRLVATNNVPSSAYCALTLASGAHIDVLGAIEVGGLMTGGRIDAAGENGISRPGGDTYGLMQMNSGSSITFYGGANLYAWGFVQGEGTIDMRRGAIAREQFQMYDWKGFMPTATMAAGGSVDYTYHVLPINQYHIQNIEVKTTYRPGSKLYGQVGAYIPSLSTAIGFNDIGIIGVKYSDAAKNANPNLEDDVAIFLMDNEDDSEDTWVRKSYDVDNDVQLYEANNSAYLGSLVMEIDLEANNISIGNPFNNNEPIDGLDVDSRDFALPITNNFKIHLLSGTLVVTQNTELLPGAVIEVDKNSTMTIEDHVWRVISGVNTWIESPQTLYLYDKDQWGTYVFVNKVEDTYNFGYASRVRFRPGGVKKVNDQYVRDISSPESLGDAKLIVHGTVDVKGYLKTTQGDKTASPVFSQKLIPNTDPARYIYKVTTSIQTSTLDTPTEGGASIISTIVDAGTINLLRHSGTNSSAYVNNYIWQIGAIGNVNKDEPDYYGDHVIAALLKNADGSYTDTKGKFSGQSYCYIDFNGVGTWKNLTADGCFVYEVVENETVYYAKPREYVALANGKTENADHTYTSATGDRTFILMDDCQWWEVEPVAERPDLFHCTHPQNDMYYYWDGSKWTEKRYTVTWKDWDGTTWATYSLKYGVQPKFLGNVPGREKDDYYTYDFVGWSPEITNSTIVTGDVTYTAQYDRKDVMYTITWLDEGDNIIEIGYFKMGEVPTCTSADMTNKEWTPAVSAVTGEATYQLQPKDNVGPYDIKFVNWDGTQIGETQSVAKNSNPTLPADPSQPAGPTNVYPTKPALDDIEFVFNGWTPTVVAATADAVYTATFTEKPITYTIIWKNSDGSELETDENVGLNVVPQYNGATPVRPEDGENYTFAGWESTVVAATENAEYVAKYIAKDKVVEEETYTVPASTHVPVTTITIKDDGKVSIPSGSLITATTLILESNGTGSGELIATNDRIHVTNAYYDLNLNIDGRHWFAFGVPWVVNLDVTPLVELNNAGEPVGTLVLGRDYEIVYYNGATRATQGAGAHCWEKVADGTHILQPGKGYMIAFAGHINTVRFAKATGTPVIFNGTVSVDANNGATDNVNGGWNAIANPMAYHVTMNAGPTTGYVHDGRVIGSDGYDLYNIENTDYIVGKAVFVQVEASKSVVIDNASGSAMTEVNAAPARRTNTGKATDKQYLSLNDYYQVSIADANEQGGSVYVLPEENKEDKYVIGHDLSHLGISDQKAQIWVFRYGTKLALNTTAPIDDVAEYTLRVYAPKNGEYTITNNQSPVSDDEYVVYLTRNGEAIWNLSDGAYTTDLTSGVHKEYGLRLSARKTPAVVTGIDEAIVDANGETKKVLINNQVFIIRGNEVYTIDGQMVK